MGRGIGVGRCSNGVVGVWMGLCRLWRVDPGTSLQNKLLIFLSGYCHERGAEEGTLVLALRLALR